MQYPKDELTDTILEMYRTVPTGTPDEIAFENHSEAVRKHLEAVVKMTRPDGIMRKLSKDSGADDSHIEHLHDHAKQALALHDEASMYSHPKYANDLKGS